MMKRSLNDDSACTSKRKVLRSNFNKFDWKNVCFICGKRKISQRIKLSIVSENSNVRNNVLNAAIIRNDTTVQERLETQENLRLVEARYHLYCYQTYINQRLLNSFGACGDTEVSENVESASNEQMDESMSNDNITYDDGNSISTFHDEVTRITVDFYKEKFESGEVIVLSDICKTYRQEMKERGNCNIVQSSWIKSQLLKIYGDSLTFHSQPGLSDIVWSSTISTGYILHKLMKNTKENAEDVDDSTCIDELHENIVLHKAAKILRKYIAEISETRNYPQPNDVCIESSKKFVPEQLQKFISWVMDEISFVNGENLSDRDESAQRRMLTLSECLIYCSRRGRCQVILPFHYGLICQLFHEFGSKKLIETLNAYGFYSTYDELRMLLTAVATMEIERSKTVYVPSGIIHVQDGGLFIQEGDDNVDMNTETIDGKNTYHAMARVLFQNQTMHEKIKSQTTPIPQQNEKSLSYDKNVLLKLLAFNKPPKRPEPVKYSNIHTIIQSKLTNYEALTVKDITWVLLRSLSRGLFGNANINTQSIPSWIAFNTFFGKQKETVTVAQYIPAINEKPSNVNTVYTTLKHGQNLVKECGQTYQVHTFDQQLYVVAQEVKFASLSEFPTLIVRIDGFHTVCDFISCIKKLWGDCDMLVESGIYAANTVDRMLEGKQFHHAVRGLTLCFEVLSTLMFESFLDSISEQNNDVIHNATDKCNEFRQNFTTDKSNCSPDFLNELIKQMESVMIPFNNYRKQRCNESLTFQYWDYCLQSLQILLQCIRAERESNWQLHLTTVIAMLPYFFACDKCNYSRWATLYVVEMLNLPEEVETEFLNRNFTINFTAGPFRSLWSDMAVEMSVIKDTKSNTSGIVGLTRKDSSVLRWTATQNILGKFATTMTFRSNSGKHNNSYKHYEHEGERPTSLKRDEEDVQKMLGYVKTYMTDPFSSKTRSDALINIGSGRVASPEIAKSLLNASFDERKKLFHFLECRLQNNSSKKQASFYDPISRNNLITFGTLSKTTLTKRDGKHISKVIKPEIVYQRALAVSMHRKEIDLATLLSHPLTDIPSSLYKPDGSRRTTAKSDLMHVLESKVSNFVIYEQPDSDNTIIVIDGMAELQSLNMTNIKTFNDVGFRIMQQLLERFKFANEIHLIFDRYDDISPNPKQEERTRRYGNDQTYRVDIHGGRVIQDFNKILSNNENKCALTTFICRYIADNIREHISIQNADKKLFLTGGLVPREDTYLVTGDSMYIESQFQCNHIDADTRLIFQVYKIQEQSAKRQTIIVESPDTDVFILLLAHYHNFKSEPFVWFYTGKTAARVNNRRYIPIFLLGNKFGKTKCLSILSLHALTGCDTTSAVFGIGKKTAFSALENLQDKELDKVANFNNLCIEESICVASTLFAAMFDPKSKTAAVRNCINSLRFHLAVKKNCSADKLPPSKSALLQHILRSKWQINEWRQASVTQIESLKPTEYGWLEENDVLYPNYFDGDSAMELLKKYVCFCGGKSPCTGSTCSCIMLNLRCCFLCKCCNECINKDEQDCIKHDVE